MMQSKYIMGALFRDIFLSLLTIAGTFRMQNSKMSTTNSGYGCGKPFKECTKKCVTLKKDKLTNN